MSEVQGVKSSSVLWVWSFQRNNAWVGMRGNNLLFSLCICYILLFFSSFTGNNPPYIQFDRWMSICAGPAIFELVVMWLWLNFYFMGMYR